MKRVVVTGASSGIGAAVARLLADEGVTVHLLGRNDASLAAAADEVRARGAVAEVHAFDLTDDATVAAFAERVPDGPDLLVHSAGIALLGRHEAFPVADLDRQFRVNVRAPFVLTQALLPGLRSARGLVVFLNSGAGWSAKAGWGGYAMSKFALRAQADSLRAEEAGNGVRVTSVYPGRTATPMQREVRRQEGGAYQEDAYVPVDEVARVILAVASLAPAATVPDVSVRPG